MTKDELMQISAKSGLTYLDGSTRADFNEDISEQLTEFANAILERAAADFESKKDAMGFHQKLVACHVAADMCRALKIKEGE